MRRFHIAAGLFVVATLCVVGCAEPNAGKSAGAGKGDASKPPAKTASSAAKPAAAAPPKATQETAKKDAAAGGPTLVEPKPQRPADGTPADGNGKQPAAGSPTSNTVMLGTPGLTAGISGVGPLTAAEIKAWLATPGVHDVLSIELPLGLNAGRSQVKGIDVNPLTRAKIELGRQLYFDARLSADGKVSCASCHAPDEGFAKHTQFGVGIKKQTGNRNSPVSYNRILTDVQFWDGRADSLETQAKGPIANPIEMGNTHEKSVATVAGIAGYRFEFEAVFGKEGVTIDNIAKAIASFERAIVTGPTPFDYYEALRPFAKMTKEDLADMQKDDAETYAKYEKLLAESQAHSMSASAVRGRDLFFGERVNCTACHVGANLTDEKYHNLGVGMDQKNPDVGRSAITKDDKEKGAFKTPTIRNVVFSAPYMHDGSQTTLEEVVAWYDKGGHPNPNLDAKIKPLKLTEQEKKDLVEFMKACTGDFPTVNTNRLPEG